MTEEEPPIDIESTLAAAAHSFLRKNRTEDAELLASAKAEINVNAYDHWDGGTTFWEFKLEIPYPNYLSVKKERREEIEKLIDDVISPFLPEIGHRVKTSIKPSEFSDPNWRHAIATQAVPLDKYQTTSDSNTHLVFISYQTNNKHVARKLQNIFQEIRIPAFLAHEDVEVSTEWRERILQEIGKATLFISILSDEYFQSPWCVQESGIAAYRGLTSLHLSIDDNTPQGFSANIQSMKINPNNLTLIELLPGIVASDFQLGIQLLIEVIGKSGSYRGAENNFRLIIPHLEKMNNQQMKDLLENIHTNDQIHHATQCAREYIPPLLKSHGQLLENSKRMFLEGICKEYA